MTTRIEQFENIQNECKLIFKNKNKDYGDAFSNHGPVGVIVRISDKISRFVNVSKNKISLVDNESLRDTLLDLHNYAAMAIILLDEEETSQKMIKTHGTNH